MYDDVHDCKSDAPGIISTEAYPSVKLQLMNCVQNVVLDLRFYVSSQNCRCCDIVADSSFGNVASDSICGMCGFLLNRLMSLIINYQ